MSKVKMIRNLKNSFENMLFVCTVFTIGAVIASLLYSILGLITATIYAVNLWVLGFICGISLFVFTQICDIWIWAIKMRRLNKKRKVTFAMRMKGILKTLNYY